MLHIFADLSEMVDETLSIGGSDYNHIRNVLRMNPGDELVVRDAEGENEGEYHFGIEAFSDSQVICRLRFVKRADVELPVKVILFQGIPKGDKMDFIVQKTVEMGVSEIVPMETRRSIVKLKGVKRVKRNDRWQAIAESAAKQSRRAYIPKVHEILSMEVALRYASEEADVLLVPYEMMADSDPMQENGTRALLEALSPGQTVAVFIGPEGGFEESEINEALESGAKAVSLGRRILRTETAGIACLSFLIYRFEL